MLSCNLTFSALLFSDIGGRQPLWLLICGSASRYAGLGGESAIRPVRREQERCRDKTIIASRTIHEENGPHSRYKTVQGLRSPVG